MVAGAHTLHPVLAVYYGKCIYTHTGQHLSKQLQQEMHSVLHRRSGLFEAPSSSLTPAALLLLLLLPAAGLHHSVENWKKPFNPILGETWQATMPGGLQLFMEQVRLGPAACGCSMQLFMQQV
jgi:hypothetical protein